MSLNSKLISSNMLLSRRIFSHPKLVLEPLPLPIVCVVLSGSYFMFSYAWCGQYGHIVVWSVWCKGRSSLWYSDCLGWITWNINKISTVLSLVWDISINVYSSDLTLVDEAGDKRNVIFLDKNIHKNIFISHQLIFFRDYCVLTGEQK